MAMGRGSGTDDTDESTGVHVSPAEAQAALRLALSLLLALGLAHRALYAVGVGTRDFVSGARWFLLCFVASRVAMAIVFGVWARYRRMIDATATAAEHRVLAVELDRRRAALASAGASSTLGSVLESSDAEVSVSVSGAAVSGAAVAPSTGSLR
jgi:hypothetical protein